MADRADRGILSVLMILILTIFVSMFSFQAGLIMASTLVIVIGYTLMSYSKRSSIPQEIW